MVEDGGSSNHATVGILSRIFHPSFMDENPTFSSYHLGSLRALALSGGMEGALPNPQR